MLTAAQHKTFQFVKQFVARHGYSPTTAEIAKGIQIKSRGVVYRYLQALVTQGLIQLMPNRRRNIQLLDPQLEHLPLVGQIAAGNPIEAISQQESIDVSQIFLGANRFALRVKGDSMIDEGILDGDIVVCSASDTAKTGQIVVALVDHEQATLKRLQCNPDNTITLFPANAQHKPQVYAADRVKIQGIFIGLLRYNNSL